MAVGGADVVQCVVEVNVAVSTTVVMVSVGTTGCHPAASGAALLETEDTVVLV